MYFYLKYKTSSRLQKKVPSKMSCLLPSRTDKVHAKKLPFILVPSGIQLALKQTGNSQHDPIPSSSKGNSKPLEAI